MLAEALSHTVLKFSATTAIYLRLQDIIIHKVTWTQEKKKSLILGK